MIGWVDAFTDTAFGGNPAAVCLVDPAAPLDEATMAALAHEFGISETAFVVPTPHLGPATFSLRWFTPSVEVDLCGHATLASAHALRQWGVVDGAVPITFATRSGPLLASFGAERISLDFPAAPMRAAALPAPLIGQWGSELVVASGRSDHFAVVVLADQGAVADYVPDLGAIAAVDASALLITARGDSADYVVRVFGPNVGIDEDPATGSAHCTAGPYWHEVLGRDEMVAKQLSERGATFYVRPDGERVHIAGHAVTVLSGDLC